jgi:hypothetical protein
MITGARSENMLLDSIEEQFAAEILRFYLKIGIYEELFMAKLLRNALCVAAPLTKKKPSVSSLHEEEHLGRRTLRLVTV